MSQHAVAPFILTRTILALALAGQLRCSRALGRAQSIPQGERFVSQQQYQTVRGEVSNRWP